MGGQKVKLPFLASISPERIGIVTGAISRTALIFKVQTVDPMKAGASRDSKASDAKYTGTQKQQLRGGI